MCIRDRRVVSGAGTQPGKAFADGFIRHRRDPEPDKRLFAAGHLVNVAEDELAFAAGVGGADERIRIPGVDQALHDLKLRTRLGKNLEFHARGQDGQVFRAPALEAFIQLLRLLERDQMTDGPGDGIAVSAQAAFAAL